MAFQKGNTGRPKGAKNKKTAAGKALVTAAVATAMTAVPALPAATNDVHPLDREIVGVDPMVLLNNIMRLAWRAYHERNAVVMSLEDTYAKMLVEAVASKDSTQQEACQQLLKQIITLRDAADAQLARASQHAIAVMPYTYARLQANTNKQIGDILVTFQNFGEGPKRKRWTKDGAIDVESTPTEVLA